MAGGVNWKQAVAEVGLLLLGAAIAFGADSWADSRSERASEQEHLLALRADFQATDSIFRTKLEGARDQHHHNSAFIQVLQGQPGSVSADSLSGMVRKAFLWDDFVPVLATYHDMVNSGDLSLLRSDPLRTAMAEFESFIESIKPYNDGALDQWSNQVTPFYIEHFNITDLYGPNSTVQIGDYEIPGIDWGPPVERIQSNEAAFWSREFLNLLAVRTIGLGDTIRFIGLALVRVEAILGLIDESLSVNESPT